MCVPQAEHCGRVYAATEHRRCGYGESITWAATMTVPNLPAHLEPSPEGASMYRKMSYQRAGQYLYWRSSGDASSFVHRFAAYDGLHNGNVLDGHGVNLRGVCAQHHQVGQLAHLDAAFQMLLE
jgi:hypothetical protein